MGAFCLPFQYSGNQESQAIFAAYVDSSAKFGLSQDQMTFDPQKYGPAVASLLEMPVAESLGPGEENIAARPQLNALTVDSLLAGKPLANNDMAQASLAGLWLRHNFLDASHRISQDIDTTTGSFWHGIMHRREPDFSNSKYWFRRVGNHPAFADLCTAAQQLATDSPAVSPAAEFLSTQSQWDPYAFVDLCEQALRGKSPDAELCLAVQRAEWEILFDYCYESAAGN